MGWLSSIPFLSFGGGVLGISVSLLSVTVMLALWVLVLMVLHPLHATLFVLAALFEYALITFFGFHLWFNFFSFFGFYILLFIIYSLFLRKILPLPKSDIEHLIKLSELKKNDLLSEEEYKAAKKKLLKLK
ncbi:MAG: hypothetical protein J6039_01615 [Alphaproteobacteria bacterium]|nr:hypothetical protein [Alphaproteobacteria bacterium]